MNGHEILLSPGFVENQHWSLGYFLFADSQKFILSCVMQATWNKSLNANIVYCVQYLEKEASFKICIDDMMCDIKHDHYTIDRDLRGICDHSPDV